MRLHDIFLVRDEIYKWLKSDDSFHGTRELVASDRHTILFKIISIPVPPTIRKLSVRELGPFFQPHYGPGVHAGYNRNKYQKIFLGVKYGRLVRLKISPPSVSRLS
jgi:hypothetical protein